MNQNHWRLGDAVEIAIRGENGRILVIDQGTVTGFRSGFTVVQWRRDGFIGGYAPDQIGKPGTHKPAPHHGAGVTTG